MTEEIKIILITIAKELKKANELKALELKYPKFLYSKHDIDEILKR